MDDLDRSRPRSWRPWLRWIFWIFAVLALALLLAEHRAHAWGWGLHALLGLCVVLLYLAFGTNARDDATDPWRQEKD